MDLERLVRELRASGGDTSDVEVKAAAGGLPPTIDRSLSALANLPGGGLVILGLDKRTGFRPVPIDPDSLKKGLASAARRCRAPVVLEISDDSVDGARVVTAQVRECAASAKPCRTAHGKAYLRAHDGDYELSLLEE